jgi:hypothetical protein
MNTKTIVQRVINLNLENNICTYKNLLLLIRSMSSNFTRRSRDVWGFPSFIPKKLNRQIQAAWYLTQ